jgi:hypothetical protein
MTLVEIEGVLHTELKAEQLQGRYIEAPKPGSQIDRDAIHIGGWVLGRDSPALSVDFVHDGKVIESTPIEVARPDIVAAFPEASGGEQSGFRTNVPIPDTGEFELLVQAVFEDQSRVPLGVIRARQSRSGEEQQSESSVQEQSKPLTGFFRRLFYGRVG